MSLFEELKRRRVFRVAGAYAIVSWLLVQIIVEVEEPLSLPAWSDTLVIVLLVIGFPIAIVLAWALDLTPEGIVVTKAADKLDESTPGVGEDDTVSTSGSPDATAASTESTETANQRDEFGKTLAVLPLENLSADPDDAYFAIGIHGEIISQLAKIKALRIIARTSVMQFTGSKRSIPEIASALNAQVIMEGTVQHAGDRFRITAQLVDAQKNTNLWADSYDRDVKDIFEIQTDIASRIADALTVELSLAEKESIQSRPTVSAEGYEHYLHALAIYREGDSASGVTAPPGKRKAIQSFLDKAIELDPEFAAAYAWKAWVYTFSRAYDPFDEKNWVEKSTALDGLVRQNAERALALDPQVGLAHAALAKVNLYNWRIAAAESDFEQALNLSPNESEVLRWYANFKWFQEQHDDAIQFAKRAVELDPENPYYYDLLGRVFHSSGNSGAAVKAFRRSIEFNPGSPMDYVSLARSELAEGNDAVALDALVSADQLMTDDVSPGLYADLANGYSRLGRRDDAGRLISCIRKTASERYVDPAVWALAYLAVGDEAQALLHLNKVLADHTLVANPFTVMFIKQNAWSDPTLDNPEFIDIRKKLGIVA
jgi:TolB-like protein/Tfp pilus assembly protein PilF